MLFSPPMEPLVAPPIYNWSLIEADYRAGVLPLSSIASKFGVSVYRLEKEARSRNWRRHRPPSASEAASAASVSDSVDSDPTVIFDPDYLRQIALREAAVVVRSHRGEIERLRVIEIALMERLALYLSGEVTNLPFKTDRESPSDMAEKLSRVMQRRIELERQAHGLASYNPDSKDAEERVSDAVKEMMTRIEDLTSKRTQPKEVKK